MIHSFSPEEFARWERFSSLSAAHQARLGPGSIWLTTGRMRHFVAEDGERFVGRLSAFVNPAMQDQPTPVGQIGALDFAADAFEKDSALLDGLLDAARVWLKSQGMASVRAPMDFSTWNTYRAITWSDGYPPFPGENVMDARYGAFLSTRMTPAATYRSALIENVETAHQVARLAKIDQAETKYGITIERVSSSQAKDKLALFYQLASLIFPCDWSFAPIGPEEFAQLMVPMSQQAPGFHSLIARDPQGEPIGLCYGFEAPFPPQLDMPPTIILKTFGVVPAWQSKMISYLLAYHFHIDLIARGFRHFMHATMKEDNRSRHMSDHFARKVRGYTLFEESLR